MSPVLSVWVSKRDGRRDGREVEKKVSRRNCQQTGAMEIVRWLLKHKFRQFTPEIEQQIGTLTLMQLENLTDRLLNFSTRADLEVWLQSQKEPSPTGGTVLIAGGASKSQGTFT
ncbi:MAG: DUF4351 domain-containing protein [Chloroflexi bacterium]|nr:DUF4351 domain-containing protein [Chloroflexota bacterium]